MKKSTLLAGLSIITMSSFSMSNNYSDSYGANCSSDSMQEITNRIETSAFRKRSGTELDPESPDKKRKISTKQISSEVSDKINDFIRTYGEIYNSYGKKLIKQVLTACLTEPDKTIREIAEEFEEDQLVVKGWLKRSGLSSKREDLINSYHESKPRLVNSVLEYSEKDLEKTAKDNGIRKCVLSQTLKNPTDQEKIQLKKNQADRIDNKKKQALIKAYREGQDLEDLYKIYDGNEKRTKRTLGELVYATLTREEEKQWITNYSGLLQDCRQGLLTAEGRIYKYNISNCKDYLVRYIARKLAKEIKENPDIEESAWWSNEFDPTPQKEDWWHNENELRYKYEREIPKEIREKMINTYNRGKLTRKGIAKLYKTKKEIVTNVLAHKTTTGHQINKRQGGGNLKEVITDLLTKSPKEVKTKYKYSDRTVRDLLLIVDHWRKLSYDQRNLFKTTMKTKFLPDLSELKESEVKGCRYINNKFRKYLFVLASTNDEVIKKYFQNIKSEETDAQKLHELQIKRTKELRQKAGIWEILAKKEMGLINAAKAGNEGVVENLIKENTDINCRDEYKQTPLMWAVAIENKGIVQHLLKHGADVNYRDENGDTALTIAKNFGHNEIANVLKQAGAK